MLEWSVGQCRIRLHFLFLVSLGVVLFTDLRSTALWGILAAVIHECGHLLLMRCCGVHPSRVEITALGVLITEQCGRIKRCLQEVLIALGGPMANGAAVLLFLLLYGGGKISGFLLANAALGLFNLLPVESLDGGRALLFLLSELLSPDKAVRVVFVCSLLVLFPTAIVGFSTLFQAERNVSLLAVTIYLILCLLYTK